MTTNTPKPLVYLDDSARRLLGDHLGKGPKYHAARVAAGKALIAQLRQLLGHYGVMTDPLPQGPGFVVFLPTAAIVVGVNEQAGTVVAGVGRGSPLPPVPLLFNPDTSLFEGHEVDLDVTPAPGTLRPRRSALEVLVEYVFGKTPTP